MRAHTKHGFDWISVTEARMRNRAHVTPSTRNPAVYTRVRILAKLDRAADYRLAVMAGSLHTQIDGMPSKTAQKLYAHRALCEARALRESLSA